MPSSHHYQLNEILELIIETNPRKLLDIGIGFGKYGFLSREYLELWESGSVYGSHTRRIDGIEAFEPYLTPLHRLIYDTIFTGDAREILPGLTERYDLILMIDVFEHFTYEDGLKVLEECRRCGRNILISVPRMMSVQDEVFGNPFEAHRYNWRRKDFGFLPDKFFLYNVKSTLCFIGEDSRRISLILKKRNRRKTMVRILELTGLKRPLKYIFRR
ncbi:MAG: class I SAM-dependent methyltransferase [Bacteroidetes bacterium]|nr:class I SAM-dependent methyltransferase [Bacteroidota bacterium]